MARKGEHAPKLLTSDIQAEIALRIADGAHWLAACRAAGLSRETAFRYRKRGRKERQPSPYRAFEVSIRQGERTAARRKAAEAAARTRQRLEGLPSELREFLTDPAAIAAEIAKVQTAAPMSGRTAIFVDRLRNLAAMFEPCPTKDLLDTGDGTDDEELELMPWELLDLDGSILRQRLAEMQARGDLDDKEEKEEPAMAEQIERQRREAGAQEVRETDEPVIVSDEAKEKHARVKEAIEREYARLIREAQDKQGRSDSE